MTDYTYTCRGDITGTCGIKHRTPEAAGRCLAKHKRAIDRLPGGTAYSDRDIIRSDGEMMHYNGVRYVTYDELWELRDSDPDPSYIVYGLDGQPVARVYDSDRQH